MVPEPADISGLTVTSPNGAPALALAALAAENPGNYTYVAADAIAGVFAKAESDFIIAPVNAGAKLFKAGTSTYKLGAVVTTAHPWLSEVAEMPPTREAHFVTKPLPSIVNVSTAEASSQNMDSFVTISGTTALSFRVHGLDVIVPAPAIPFTERLCPARSTVTPSLTKIAPSTTSSSVSL